MHPVHARARASPHVYGTCMARVWHVQVVKQLTIAYASFTALIGYGLYSSSVRDCMPMTLIAC